MRTALLRLAFGFWALLASGIIMMDIFSYYEIVGPDNIEVINREAAKPWIIWMLVLPCTIYCSFYFFNPNYIRKKKL